MISKARANLSERSGEPWGEAPRPSAASWRATLPRRWGICPMPHIDSLRHGVPDGGNANLPPKVVCETTWLRNLEHGGLRSRSVIDSSKIFLMITACGPAPKRSTRQSMHRAVWPCHESSRPRCVRDEQQENPGAIQLTGPADLRNLWFLSPNGL